MSKRKELAEKYDAIRKTIQSNVKTIRSLVAQADELTSLIDESKDPELKEKLSKSVECLYQNIDSLIEESNKLFDQYIDFANSVAE